MDMPTAAPAHRPWRQAVDDVRLRDRIMRGFPEVEQVVGKIGRAETATGSVAGGDGGDGRSTCTRSRSGRGVR